MASTLNEVDLAFVVDTTGSMGAFIGAAREQMTGLLWALARDAATPIDLRVGLVEYRDHPPQERSFVARPHAFSADLAQTQRVIDKLQPTGGGDAPEAVHDGLRGAAELGWRPHARRLAVLVGDAPPHGAGFAGDGFPKGCPCGLTVEGATALLEERNVTLYAVGLTQCVRETFTKLARYTGGAYFEAGAGPGALEALRELLAREFADVDFDRRVLEACAGSPDWSVDGLGEALGSARGPIAASLGRLGRRGLLA
jgi:hypothetical protein